MATTTEKKFLNSHMHSDFCTKLLLGNTERQRDGVFDVIPFQTHNFCASGARRLLFLPKLVNLAISKGLHTKRKLAG